MLLRQKVLNRELYGALVRRFKHVDVLNEGQANWPWTLVPSPHARSGFRRRIEQRGETYRIGCPVCHRDNKCYINHMWSVWDAETRTRHLELIICFHDDCFADGGWKHRLSLYEQLTRVGRLREAQPRPGVVDPQAGQLRAVDPPGELIPLVELPADHHAFEYIESRGFDPAELSRLWHVGYCPESRFGLARDRLIIPVHWPLDGKLQVVGWQARAIGEPDGDWPKYWTCPGFQRGRALYNLARAVTFPTVVIVEGPTDAWSFGLAAVALWGKVATTYQRQVLVAQLRRRHGNRARIVVMLDPEQSESDRRRGKPHHIDRLVAELRPSGIPIVAARLPLPRHAGELKDPGDYCRESLRQFVLDEAREQGVALDFRPRGASDIRRRL